YNPRETARRALDGDESLLTDDRLWYCFYCYTCQSRCPRHNSVAVINQVLRGLQVDSGQAHRHVKPFAEWCAAFYEKGMGGNPHLLFPAIGEAWGEKWTSFMEHLLEVRAELGLGDLFPPEDTVKEVRIIMEESGFKERLRAVREGGPEDEAPATDRV
ncbi:MAG TPA: heterodisulfide reductase subunit C, partial [Thermoleophilia bacterium]|nr:heterodisulfide reductase subunit C [Thermoleophilia bacterium]